MKKQGFTLIELLISLILVAVLLSTMTAGLVKIKHNYDTVSDKSDLEVEIASATRIISNDLNKNFLKNSIENSYSSWNVFFINCNKNYCLIDNKSNKTDRIKRLIVIDTIDNFKLSFIEDENEESNNYSGIKRVDKSSLKYYDITGVNESLIFDSSGTLMSDYETHTNLIYIKTIDYVCRTVEALPHETVIPASIADSTCKYLSGDKFNEIDQKSVEIGTSNDKRYLVITNIKLLKNKFVIQLPTGVSNKKSSSQN